ncbi:hypothetical protein ACWENQ_01060 [Nonomuraea sp. NPDC004354]
MIKIVAACGGQVRVPDSVSAHDLHQTATFQRAGRHLVGVEIDDLLWTALLDPFQDRELSFGKGSTDIHHGASGSQGCRSRQPTVAKRTQLVTDHHAPAAKMIFTYLHVSRISDES